jgi:succinyl-diaminopimelate desuccinylase
MTDIKKAIEEKIEGYRADILRDLGTLVAIPSVRGNAKEGMPFGEKSFEALQFVLQRAQEMGFQTKNVSSYAGHAEYGTGEDYAAVAVHVDVVPAGDGWKHEPFCMQEEDGKIYGRGVSDDKGPAICALYGLKAISELGITGARRLRVIFGAGEETGMEDLSAYFAEEPYPVMGFSPDGGYPAVNRESGILNILAKFKAYDSIVSRFYGGLVYNAVPAYAVCYVDDKSSQIDALNEHAKKFSKGEYGIKASAERGKVKLESTGLACHAGDAGDGFNAVLNLIRFLADYYHEKAGRAFCQIAEYIGIETDGNSLGIAFDDHVSRKLVLNVGKINFENGKGEIAIDIRYPVLAKGEEIVNTIKEKLSCCSLILEEDHKPLYVKEDSPLIRVLSHVYQESTGKEMELLAYTGGTYARHLGNMAVAFGASFGEGSDGNIHMSDEYMNIDRLMDHAKICAKAMAALMCEEI